jgi:hypothetical protein
MSIRPLLDRYVRSLTERDHDPGSLQDLGTFMYWLLLRMGYQIHRRVFRYEGTDRKLLSGVREHGIDIVASRPDEGRTYCFILKTGAIGTAEFAPGKRGNIFHDLGRAEFVPEAELKALGVEDVGEVVLVAVHNGDLRRDQVGSLVEEFKQRFMRTLEWWDADRIVEEALMPTRDGTSIRDTADASLFPPAVQAFVRMAVDSLQRKPYGRGFDYWAVDRLSESRLPLEPDRTNAMNERQIHSIFSELALFAGMLGVDCKRVSGGTTLPVLDALERVICRVAVTCSRSEELPALWRDDLEVLLDEYIEAASTLLDHLGPVLDVPFGLAGYHDAERIAYPLRSIRFAGYLATAGLVALDRERRVEAERFAKALSRMVAQNQAGVLSPVIDDQLIELSAMWTLWARLDMSNRVGETARALVERFAERARAGARLPAIWMTAKLPYDEASLETLVEAWMVGPKTPGFEDRGSLLFPLAAYLADRYGEGVPDWCLEALGPKSAGADRRASAVFPQSWQPPPVLWKLWYHQDTGDTGTAYVHATKGIDALLRDFVSHAAPIQPSPLERFGFPCVDWIAWKTFRTPPPMARMLAEGEH